MSMAEVGKTVDDVSQSRAVATLRDPGVVDGDGGLVKLADVVQGVPLRLLKRRAGVYNYKTRS